MRTLSLLLLTGCLPTIAPPAHYAAMGPTVAVEEPEIEVAASCCFLPAVGMAYDTPLGEGGRLAGQLQGQLGPTHGSVTPALFIRNREGHTRYGLRIGATAGMGDIYALPYKMPWGGGGLHFVLSTATGRDERSRFTFATGAEVSWPAYFYDENWVVTDDNGQQVVILPLPNAFISLDLRYDIATSRKLWFFIGGGVDVSIYGFPVPALTLGGRG
jgi:hypothetical protein